MLIIRHTLLFLSILSMPFISKAQLWNKSFEKEVNFLKVTEAGTVIIGTDDALYGVNTSGEILWKNEKLRKIEEERIELLDGSELIFASDKGLLGANRVLNVINGVEYARVEDVKGPNILGARVIHGTNTLLVVKSNNHLEAWDIATNQKKWDLKDLPYGMSLNKMANLTATFKGMQPIIYTSDDSGIMHLGTGHLANYDFKTGKVIWSFDFKPYKFKKPGGKNSDVASNPSSGFATMRIEPSSNSLFFPFRNKVIAIDLNTGKPKWDVDANKIAKAKDIQVTDEGLLVLGYSGLNLLDLNTGMPIWDKPLKVKGVSDGLLVKENEKTFFMVSKNVVLSIDIAAKSSKQLTDKMKFEGGDSFSSIELKEDMILLTGNQNIVGIDKSSGEIRYQEYYKAPGAGLGTILQNVALTAVAVAATSNSQNLGLQSANANGSYTYHQYTPALRDAGTRKSAMSNNYMYINTKFKGKGFGLARIDKENGELMDEIIIGDRSPVYDKDESAELIFFKSDKNEISCKKLTK